MHDLGFGSASTDLFSVYPRQTHKPPERAVFLFLPNTCDSSRTASLHPSDTPERLPVTVYALDGRLYPLITLQFKREPVCHWDGYGEGATVLEHEVNLLR